jgi:hypothetical protein
MFIDLSFLSKLVKYISSSYLFLFPAPFLPRPWLLASLPLPNTTTPNEAAVFMTLLLANDIFIYYILFVCWIYTDNRMEQFLNLVFLDCLLKIQSQGVELSHFAVVETVISLEWFLYAHKVGLTEKDSMLGFLPLAHIFERCRVHFFFP